VFILQEKRARNDIIRNAMVGIFLRLLEVEWSVLSSLLKYHQGVLFLTTNRVVDFDPAFHSRISIALKYQELDELAR